MSATHSFASFRGIVRIFNEIFRKAEQTSKSFIMMRWLMLIVSLGYNLSAETISNKNHIKRKVTLFRSFTFEFTRDNHGNSRYRSIWAECSSGVWDDSRHASHKMQQSNGASEDDSASSSFSSDTMIHLSGHPSVPSMFDYHKNSWIALLN